ncbi:MAG: adenine deaminase, partial [Saprospiraceae bacterium]|nr:adenine deaminase [Saprospiraceae bacterium]
LDAAAVEKLLQRPDIAYLSELMNFPGVLHEEEQVMAKIAAAHRLGKPVDGHAPGLRGEAAKRYFAAGITTDHECFTFEEALEKARLGVKILIREGSAARNFDALWPLLLEMPHRVMFCSDDKHPDDLIQGHINQLCARAVANGCDVFDVLRSACVLPVEHYGLPLGLLREGDRADFIRVENLEDFARPDVWIAGKQVASGGKSLLPHQPSTTPNHFEAQLREPADFALVEKGHTGLVRAIKALDGQIVTEGMDARAQRQDGKLLPYPSQDLLKIIVLNRYAPRANPAIGFVKGFGMTHGAIASSVAHDSHNIVAVGADDQALCDAVNAVIRNKGGISACDGRGNTLSLALPVAGLMSNTDGYQLAHNYADIDEWTKTQLRCTLRAPFMVLSFLALPVIPALKMTDLGLFDVERFEFADVEIARE